MPRVVFPAGTDVAEMAIFSLAALPSRFDNSVVTRLEADGSLIRFGTGADGGYLLHAYVEEPVPEKVLRFCNRGDTKTATLKLPDGRIGFGGSESVFADFAANNQIRSDAQLPPGTYHVIAYHTDYPDEELESAIRARIGAAGQRLLGLPAYIIWLGVLLALSAFFVERWYAAVAVLLTAMTVILYLRHPSIVRLQAQAEAVQLEYPSIVLSMTRSS